MDGTFMWLVGMTLAYSVVLALATLFLDWVLSHWHKETSSVRKFITTSFCLFGIGLFVLYGIKAIQYRDETLMANREVTGDYEILDYSLTKNGYNAYYYNVRIKETNTEETSVLTIPLEDIVMSVDGDARIIHYDSTYKSKMPIPEFHQEYWELTLPAKRNQ